MAVLRPDNPHQSRLLRLLRDGGPRSRAELADMVDLSRSKLMAELDRLIELGLIRPAGRASSRGGRPSSMVRISEQIRFLTVDIGINWLEVAITDGELNVLGCVREATDVRSGPEAVLGLVLELAGKVQAEVGMTQLSGACFSLPGPVSFHEGLPVSPPLMPGWHRHPVREVMSAELGCPVVVENRVNTMALGEKHVGAARSFDDFLLLNIDSGIGCGIVLGGGVYRGVTGCAGDIGHMRIEDGGPVCACGNTGCLEAVCGGTALVREARAAARSGRSEPLARRLSEAGDLTAADVAEAAATGDPVALELVRSKARRIGQVLAGLVSFLNPGLVVLATSVPGIRPVLLAEIRSAVYQRSTPLATGDLPIVLSELGDRAAVIGGAVAISDLIFAVDRP